jgi:hypothetical protein
VKHVGIRIKPIRPDDGPGLLTDPDLPKVVGIAKGITQRSTQQRREIDITDKPVTERQTEIVGVKWLHSSYTEGHSQHVREADRWGQGAAWPGRDINLSVSPNGRTKTSRQQFLLMTKTAVLLFKGLPRRPRVLMIETGSSLDHLRDTAPCKRHGLDG